MTKSWVLFLLAYLFFGVRASGLGPLVSEVRLPEFLRSKPIWTIEELPRGQIALGFEGGVAFGMPNGAWELVATPRGQVVQTISHRDEDLLVAGSGFCGLVRDGNIIMIPGMEGEYLSSEPVDEGWLVAGRNGLWLISPDGSSKSVLPPSLSGNQTRVAKIGADIVISNPGDTPRIWKNGDLTVKPNLSALGDLRIYWKAGDYLATSRGILTDAGNAVFRGPDAQHLLDSGIVGLASAGPWIVVPTFTSGIYAYRPGAEESAWEWRPEGNVYCFIPYNGGYLIGTADGLFAMGDPWTTQFTALNNEAIFQVQTNVRGELEVMTGSGTITIKDTNIRAISDQSTQWPATKDASVVDKILMFKGSSATLPYRFVKGLAVTADAAAVVLDHGMVSLTVNGVTHTAPIDGVINSLASDGLNFIAGSNTRGAYTFSPTGELKAQIGTGRVAVREVRPGKVTLLFWDGTILDSDVNLVGKIENGNPRDATLIQGKLAVLTTRPGRDPVLGTIEGGTWQPLEIPGLAQIGAEHITATENYLFAAGPRGVIRVRLPIPQSQTPNPELNWSARVEDKRIYLRSSAEEFAQVTAISPDFPTSPSTQLRVRVGMGPWSELQLGSQFKIPVSWGETLLSTQAERNGLIVERQFTVIRPWPWWLRPWAWPLHVGLTAGLVIGLARLRTRRLERRNRELERRVALRTSELRKANAAKEEFLAGISHEIRNPLNGVVGICAMLADREVGPREKMLVRTLGGCADQLRSMLDDILDFSRIERGDVAVTNQDFELVALIEESAMVMDPERSACTLILPDEAVWLHGDSGKLRQIACNLISNALKYGVPREAGIEVRVENAGGGRSRIRIAVRNSGPTIPVDEIPRLFESFQRGSRTAGMPGSGLGLAVCRRLIQSMGGRITAASIDGVTEFAIEVLLPNARPPEKAVELPAMVSRALAIEDEDYNRIALGHVLRALGYQVDWAADGTSALKLASERQYDLVLTDWRLPDMNGGDLCKRILSLLPNPKPPVIAVTAYSTTEKLDEARAAGMTGFVTKPITKEKLSRVIRGLSEGLQPRRSLDINLAAAPASPLASLGDLAPSCEQLASDIAARWQSTTTLAELRDPRTPREAHALRSLLLLASEEGAAEQIALLESAAESADWSTVDKLLPFAAEEIAQTRQRLTA